MHVINRHSIECQIIEFEFIVTPTKKCCEKKSVAKMYKNTWWKRFIFMMNFFSSRRRNRIYGCKQLCTDWFFFFCYNVRLKKILFSLKNIFQFECMLNEIFQNRTENCQWYSSVFNRYDSASYRIQSIKTMLQKLFNLSKIENQTNCK